MELLHTALWLMGLWSQLNAAYIGISSNRNRQLDDKELDRSLVPMIRLPRHQSMFLKPSISSYLTEKTEPELYKYTDNGLRPESDIKPIHSQSRKFADILKEQQQLQQQQQIIDVTEKPDHESMTANGMIAVQGEAVDDSKKEFLPPAEGNCMMDGHRVINSEEIFQNDCGTLQCIDSQVTWSLKPLAKTLPHCEGVKSIPSMFKSFANIKIVDDESQEQMAAGKKSGPTKPDADIVDQRKKIEEASRRMIEAENWD